MGNHEHVNAERAVRAWQEAAREIAAEAREEAAREHREMEAQIEPMISAADAALALAQAAAIQTAALQVRALEAADTAHAAELALHVAEAELDAFLRVRSSSRRRNRRRNRRMFYVRRSHLAA